MHGRVINSLGRPIRGAKISVEGDTKVVTTDRDGKFHIVAPDGATLVIDANTYEVGIATIAGPTLDDIVLLTLGQRSETIEIKGEAPAAAPGAAKLDRQELQRLPGTGGDVVRALTVMPGIANQQLPLGSMSGVVIRGSAPQDSKVLVDDFEIPVLMHNIGFRSVLPAEAIQSLEFLPGGFDVAFGRASSGIVSLVTRPGSDQRSTQAEVSMIDGGLLAQGRIGKKTNYMFGLRRSTIDLVLPGLIPDSVDLSLTTVPSYWDGQFRIDHQLTSKWKLALSGVGTTDTFELYTTKDTESATKRFFNQTRFFRLTGSATYHDGPWTAKLALSGIAPEFTFEFGAFQHIKWRQPAITPRAEVTRTWDKKLGLTNVEWRTGVEAQIGRASFDMASPPDIRDGEQYSGYDPRDTSMSIKDTFWLPDFAGWSSVSANLDPRIRATVGVRTDAFARTGEVAVQPRGELKVKLTPTLTARLSSGAYVRPAEYQTENFSPDARSEHSTQNIVGLQYEPREGIRLQTSAYYTDRTKLLTRETGAGMLENFGRGTTVGAELLATYRGGPWFGWLSYSYSHSTRVDRPGAEERLFNFDQPHSMNAALSWKSGHWQLGGRFQLYSGMPYTPVLGSVFMSDRNLFVPQFGDTNSERAPIHHQLDLRIDYSWKWGPAAMSAFLDVQNVYMNKSIVTYYYGYDFTQRSEFTALPLIPSIGLRGTL
ncbi:MAG TPA: TonB-dependent receptor plug domain-containing protein [Kofleriaceae bacterium]|nr:TonB-dependent receptor plug domain-containing protein [Kofleriaceae bacterium]